MIASAMRRLVGALSFLTLLPVSAQDARTLSGSAIYFPVAGLVVGAILWTLYAVLAPWIAAWGMAFVLIVAGAILTRGFHLDGLADSADGLLSHKDPERILEIMRDSRIGTMGTLALILDLMLRFELLLKIPSNRMFVALVASAVLSRMAMAAGMMTFPYARKSGLASVFAQGPSVKDLVFVLAVGLGIVVMVGGSSALLLWGCALILALMVLVACKKMVGGYTGDILGAVNEVVEILILALAGFAL